MLSLRSFMFETCISARTPPTSTRRSARRSAASSSTSSTSGATTSSSATDYLAGMTDRFALAFRASADGANQGQLGRGGEVGRRDPAARRGLRAAAKGRRHVQGTLPVPSGAHAELHGHAGARHVQVLRLRRGRRRDHVRHEDGAGRLRRCDRIAREALRRRDRVRGDLARGRAGSAAQGSPDAAARARDRFYERVLWDTSRAPSRASTSGRAASTRRSAARSASATRRAGRRSTRGARRRATRATSCSRPGSGTVAATTISRGVSSSRSPTRAALVRGFQARKLYDDDLLQAKYVNSPESDVFKKGDLLYGLDIARIRDREAGPRGRR